MKTDDFLDIEQLKSFLGYIDERSVLKWCTTNKIPVIKLGLKKYVASHYLTHIIDNQLVTFVEKTESKKQIEKTNSEPYGDTENLNNRDSFKPADELIAKYLLKYESDGKSHITKKR